MQRLCFAVFIPAGVQTFLSGYNSGCLLVVWFVDPGGVLSAHRGSAHWLLFKCDSSFNVTDVRDIYRQSGTSEVLNDKSH